jgi:hypothetical protein
MRPRTPTLEWVPNHVTLRPNGKSVPATLEWNYHGSYDMGVYCTGSGIFAGLDGRWKVNGTHYQRYAFSDTEREDQECSWTAIHWYNDGSGSQELTATLTIEVKVKQRSSLPP